MDPLEPKKNKKRGKLGLSQDQRAELLRRMHAGEDAETLSGKVGFSRNYLLRLLKEEMESPHVKPEFANRPAWLKKSVRGSTTLAQREEIVRRGIAGEKLVDIAKEFNVTRAYISLLKNQALYPERFVVESEYTKKLKPSEIAEFKEVIASSAPTDHDLIPHSEDWSIDHGYQLAEKLFKKRPSKRTIVECLTPYLQERRPNYFSRPRPPKPPHLSQIHPDLAKDPEFVAYCMSPLAQRLAQKEYEFALADYEARFASDEERAQIAAEKAIQAAHSVPPARKGLGKHARSKGSPFTPAKRKKRR